MERRKVLPHLACASALLGMLVGTLPLAAQQSASASPATAGDSASASGARVIPDSPGAVRSTAQASEGSDDPPGLVARNQSAEGNAAQSESAAPQRPVGTAAAEAPNVNAIAASQPAGVAIAPAKQHRVRTIVLKTGAIIGAGVAIGVVVALTAATPPKPPGAH